ncbi:hypothetical protein SARC_08662 [Sphaeroforma arctica JP610]|uniref:CENP-V/GFA domain-containing protein n=1 Tax=Sphaeroforma arctica JP610 TaxID=667725 RepID=A0A0L0FSH5_9EUKA|nr:hypothetical protein SARC_08662 [Sphaeroforma arctica JP610]KNC78928.1 hypothetical protein SARC_08662 [Sphaeroforma arctica JP610]|eukprot:XP_014152830.1 hypothetical protein SARC_08662 [Sphaeroforma arctica JP610]
MSASGTYVCLCNAVGFELTGEPALACYCHCNTCRVYGGAPARVGAYSPEQFKLTKGSANLISYESGPGKIRNSCKTCGSMIYHILPNGLAVPPLGGVKWASDGVPVVPTMHIWYGDKGLEEANDDFIKYDGFPAGFA